MNNIYFFDTYAIIEIIKGNPDYDKYTFAKIITSFLNIIELHYILLKEWNNDFANEMAAKYSKYVAPITLMDIEEGNKFRLKNVKNHRSIDRWHALLNNKTGGF